jgi:hypothetical protein
MAISEAYAGSTTISSTSGYSLTAESTTIAAQTDDGVYQLFLDTSAMTTGDIFDIQALEKVQAASTQRSCHLWRLSGVQVEPNFVSPSLILLHGWDLTVTMVSTTARSFEWSIRKIA